MQTLIARLKAWLQARARKRAEAEARAWAQVRDELIRQASRRMR